MIIIGIRLFFWGSQSTSQAMHCGRCGYVGPFVLKSGMRLSMTCSLGELQVRMGKL